MVEHSASARVDHFADLIEAVIDYAETFASGDDTSSLDELGMATALRAAADRLDPANAEPAAPVVEKPVEEPKEEPKEPWGDYNVDYSPKGKKSKK